jgi:hypothetical protein
MVARISQWKERYAHQDCVACERSICCVAGYFPKQYVTIVGEGIAKSQLADVFHTEQPPLARALFDFVGQGDKVCSACVRCV